MEKSAKIYVAGHNGMVGSAIVRKLKSEGYTNILTASSKELNLIDLKEEQFDPFSLTEDMKGKYTKT